MEAENFGYHQNGSCNVPLKAPCGALAFDSLARAKAIPSTVDLFNFAVANGVTVFFITGRLESEAERSATVQNLRQAGYYEWQELYLRDPNGRDKEYKTIANCKTARRVEIEKNGYTIIANIGDQWSDLNGDHPDKALDFKLPNPFYVIP